MSELIPVWWWILLQNINALNAASWKIAYNVDVSFRQGHLQSFIKLEYLLIWKTYVEQASSLVTYCEYKISIGLVTVKGIIATYV